MRDREFIDQYGLTPEDVADKYFGKYKVKGDEIIPQLCPFCGGGQHNDKQTFALNTKDGSYNCKRQSCGVKGSYHDLLEEFGELEEDFTVSPRTKPHESNIHEASNIGNEEDNFEKPDTSSLSSDINQEIIDWFDWRGISKETLETWNVMEEDGNIAFPYYNRSGDEVVLTKYRTPNRTKDDKQIWQNGGGKHILWGVERLKLDEPLIIVEGEIDALTLTEVGYRHNATDSW